MTLYAERWAAFWSRPWILRDPVTLEPIERPDVEDRGDEDPPTP
jgi:hypothetical protein